MHFNSVCKMEAYDLNKIFKSLEIYIIYDYILKI